MIRQDQAVHAVPGSANTEMKNAFTIDVEDYFQVEAFARVIDRSSWNGFNTRVVANTDRLLAMLAEQMLSLRPSS